MRKGVSVGLPLAALGVVTVVGAVLAWADQGPPTVPPEYRSLVVAAAATCPGLDSRVLAAQLEQESGWNPRAVSARGAQGIAQFLPRTWKAYAVDGDGDGVKDVWNPKDAIVSAAHFDCLLFTEVGRVPGNRVRLMLAAYNSGASTVRSYDGVPPFPETRQYVDSIVTRSSVLTIGPVS
jgi:soluble lytic murein transglycosylase-like protein